jgi:ketosteroid isomerase-like protein
MASRASRVLGGNPLKKTILALSIVAGLGGTSAYAASRADTAREILALERKAMDGWLKGDPEPLLAISDDDITYFHVMTDKRLDGLAAVKAIVEPFRGRSLFDSYDMLEPQVQVGGDMAVLTYVLVRRNGPATSRWNATQVYQRKPHGWRIVHTHWSQTRPPLAPAPQQ